MTTTLIGQASGTIQLIGDSDWFKFQLSAGTQYVFDVSSTGLNYASVTLYDSGGNAIISGISASSKGDAITSFEPTSPGTYYIGVSGQDNSTGAYSLLVSTGAPDFVGNTNTAGAIAVGGQASGTIAVPGQSDWFKVQLNAGTEYVFTINGALTSPLVTLYNSTGSEVFDGNVGQTLSGNALAYMPMQGGTYYVGVSGQQAGTGSFTVSAASVAVDYAGNTTTQGQVAVGGSVSGNIGVIGQNDWFKVQLTAGTEYVFDVGGGTLASPSVALYDSHGTLLTDGSDGGPSGGARISYEPTASGTYFVGASGINSTTGSFTVAVSTATFDFAGSTSTTGTVSVGGNSSGNITTVDQSDWFKVTLNAGTEYVFDVGGGTLGGPTVTLYNSSGVPLAAGTGGGPNGGARTSFEAITSGTYYVGAASSNASTGTFNVVVSTATPDYLGNTSTTGTVAVGGKVSGTIATVGQSDWFKVQLTGGQQYAFTAGGGTLTLPVVSLYDSTGALVVTGQDGGSGTYSVTSFTPTASGTYYVAASGDQSTTGTFTVSVATGATTPVTGISTAASINPVVSVATALAEYQAHSLTAPVAISDSMTTVQANLDALEPLAAAGLISSVIPTDNGTPTLTVTSGQLSSDSVIIKSIKSGYSLNVTGQSTSVSTFVTAENGAYVPGTTHSGNDQVIGFQSANFTSNFNAVVLDQARSHYAVQVDATGKITITDINSADGANFNQTITVKGANYIVFNGASSQPYNFDGNIYPIFDQIYFVETAADAQMAEFYSAVFQRQPDLAGVEYWLTALNSGGSIQNISQDFLQILHNSYLTGSPITTLGGDPFAMTNTQFLTALYQNILGHSPDTAGLAYWLGVMNGGVTEAQMLVAFTGFAETLNNANATPAGGWLINSAVTGGYADSTLLMSAQSVVTQAATSGYLNTALIDPTTVSSGVAAGGLQVAAGTVTVGATANGETVVLSPNFSSVTMHGTNGTVVDGTSGSETITMTGSTNTILELGHGSTDAIYALGGTNTAILGFTPGSGSVLHVANGANSANVVMLDGTTTPISSLTFGTGNVYVINIGTLADTSTTTAAAAANRAYVVADTSGAGTPLGTGEYITFMAKDAAGDTLFYFWGSTSGAANGVIPAASLAHSADANGNHLVDPGELTLVATLVGVAPSQLTAASLA